MIVRMSAEDRRAAIVEAAIRLFSERGFRGTTTRALADAVGVTEPVLYEHFKSKRDLYCAIIDTKSREGFARAAQLLEPYAEARDDRGLFMVLGEFVLRNFTEDPAYARLLLSVALEDPELGNLFYERQREGREALACYIRQRMKEGAFRAVDPVIAARAFIGMFAYHGMQKLLYGDNFAKGPEVESMVEIFLSGIRLHRTRQGTASK
jgi:AcrR family transcriptional regulator